MILGIETAAKTSSVAVLKDNILAAEITVETPLFHSETLVENIAAALKEVGAAKKDLTHVSVDVGPGSFTGLRIGLATAKAMAYALDIPLVGVSATAVLARGFWGTDALVYALIDAQKNNAYVEGYRFDGGNLLAVEPMRITSVKDFATKLSGDEKIILTGDAAQKQFRGISLPPNTFVAPPDKIMPRAASVALLGKERAEKGESDDVMTVEPMYYRRSEAEILWERRHG